MKVIEVKNISKTYAIGTAAKDSIIDSVRGLFKSKTQSKSTFNALTDISFEVNQGEVLGIVGKNGAGKSTLLKVLSRITEPTNGEIIMRGRVASLLEVGTGFHPELSGRENIFLNGSILGMTRAEIKFKFDEIVAFSGVEKFIDTPVKHYSSGMYVRLAFSVAAHLEPEILIIDEVLAVGDAEFQKKCLGKMKDVAGQGRTVLFVSHNMAAVKSLCSRAILLDNGFKVEDSDVSNIVDIYLKGSSNYSNSHKSFTKGEIIYNGFRISSFGVKPEGGKYSDAISLDDKIQIGISYENSCLKRLDFILRFKGVDGTYIFATSSGYMEESIISYGKHDAYVTIDDYFFNSKSYQIDLIVVEDLKNEVLLIEDILTLTVNPKKAEIGHLSGEGKVFLKPRFIWTKL